MSKSEHPLEHRPKTAALIAYDSGALSARGRARLDRHLASCGACRRELAAMQVYDESVDVIRDARLPPVDWSRMELALEREARAVAKTQRQARRGWLVPAFGMALAAAAIVGLLVWPSGDEEAPVAVGTDPQPSLDDRASLPTAPAVAAMTGEVTLVAGVARSVVGGEERGPLTAGARLAEGTRLMTDEGGTLHGSLTSADDETPAIGFALADGSRVELAALDATEATLTLESGRVSMRSRTARTVVLAGEYRIAAEVAWFTVDLDESGEVRVDVTEGSVHVTGPSVDRSVSGPGALVPSTGSTERVTVEGVADPVGMLVGYGELPSLHLARPGIVRWQVGDAPVVHGAGELAMRIGTGQVSITGWDSRGHAFHATGVVGADGLDLTPSDLVPEGPRVHVGVLAPEVIQRVVRSHQASLRRCYDHALHQQPDLAVRIEAQITIDLTGEVSGVRLRGDRMPDAMRGCVVHDVESWTFPAPEGGPVTFVLPLPFVPPGH